MPKQSRRRGRRPNVFVQESAPRGREELEGDAPLDADVLEGESSDSAGTAAATAVATGRSRRLRAQRSARQARVRSDVFTRSIGKELRKLGVLTGVIVVILAVLTFTL